MEVEEAMTLTAEQKQHIRQLLKSIAQTVNEWELQAANDHFDDIEMSLAEQPPVIIEEMANLSCYITDIREGGDA